MDILIGLDLGTTNCKALAFDVAGRLQARAVAPTPLNATATAAGDSPLYDAEQLWHTSARLIRQVVEQLRPDQRPAGLAVASMGEAGVLVDAAGQPLAPVLTWHDRRTLPWNDWWRQRLDEEAIYAITGLPLDHIYSAHKLLWHRQQDPAAFARSRHWLCLSDWIAYRLTEVAATSYSMASRTMLFDLRRRAWSEELLRLAELSPQLLPPALPSGQTVGGVTAAASQITGLPAGLPVATGGHDHVCAALAAGVIDPGAVLNSSGTTDTILASLTQPVLTGPAARSGLCCGCHTAPDRYYLVGGFMSGAVVGWVSQILAGDAEMATLEALMAAAAAAPPLANGVWFLPYLGGSGPPDRDADAWGAWLGLRLYHTPADLARAAMEGLSFALRYLLEGHQRITGSTAAALRAVGGGTRNTWWQQLKADVLGLPVEVPEVSEVTARGAALLAGLAVGLYRDAADAAGQAYRPTGRFEPEPQRQALYDQAYRQTFRKLYPTLRALQGVSYVP